MKAYAYFIQLGLLAGTHWLLTCALGAVGFLAELLARGGYQPLPDAVDEAWSAALAAGSLTWPLVPLLFLANLWILAAHRPRHRLARLLGALAVGNGLLLLAAAFLVDLADSITAALATHKAPLPPAVLPQVLRLAGPWVLASYLAAAWLYRPWLRAAG